MDRLAGERNHRAQAAGEARGALKRPSPVCLHCGRDSRGFAICFTCKKRLGAGLQKRLTKWYGRDEARHALAIVDALRLLKSAG